MNQSLSVEQFIAIQLKLLTLCSIFLIQIINELIIFLFTHSNVLNKQIFKLRKKRYLNYCTAAPKHCDSLLLGVPLLQEHLCF